MVPAVGRSTAYELSTVKHVVAVLAKLQTLPSGYTPVPRIASRILPGSYVYTDHPGSAGWSGAEYIGIDGEQDEVVEERYLGRHGQLLPFNSLGPAYGAAFSFYGRRLGCARTLLIVSMNLADTDAAKIFLHSSRWYIIPSSKWRIIIQMRDVCSHSDL